MKRLAARIFSVIPVLFGLCVISYTLLAMIPGDPITAMLGMDATPEAVTVLRAKYDLDAPLPIRFLSWFGHLLTGDLGRSIQTGREVAGMVTTALVPTMELGFAALIISLLIAIPAGVISAAKRNRAPDYFVSVLSLAGLSLPSFWLAILLILFFSIRLQIFPSSGYVPFNVDPFSALWHMTLPAITLGVAMAASTMRMTRAAMLDVLTADYIRTARAKGLPWHKVVWKHGLRNALIPVTTLVGLQLGQLMGGVVVTETVFAWPGIGKLTVDAIFARDFPVVQGAILISAALFVAINLVTDLVYTVLDPRLRKN
ncbi:ABC transporter permease [Rhizobium laguerreae]|uniref:ABC transporter permease n=1 Tax=Rhizobium laguerreae TaxID=1076926 RepID=UPI001C9265D6|nr:ABC transporter permease [Rhizobium laguerreae]MBY3307667.1 ABC transporter permease [Rhizobium laguerreae]